MSLQLRNPHSVLAVLETRPRDVLEIRLGTGRASEAWEEAAALAQRHGVSVVRGARPEARPKGAEKSQRLGAAEALVRERGDVLLEELFRNAQHRAEGRGLWLALDMLQDPHNVGAIFRTACFFGVQGIVTTRDRSAPLSGTVYDVASGGVEHVPFSLQTNLSRALEAAKTAGLWVLGSSEHALQDVGAIQRDRPWLLVLGNEENGLRRLTVENCDELCRITPRGPVGSLNVSVAAAVLIATLTSR